MKRGWRFLKRRGWAMSKALVRQALIPSIFAVGLGFGMVGGAAHAQAPAKGAKQVVVGAPVSYYDEDRRVDLVVALDELAVELPAGVAPSDLGKARGVRAVDSLGGPRSARVKLEAQQPDRAALEARARELRGAMAGAQVRAVLYPPTAVERKPEQAIQLTNRLAVRLREGGDIKQVAAALGLRAVEKVSYSPNTYILEAQGEGLFEALDAANTIHSWGIAEFATPLVLKKQTKKLIPNDPLFGRQWHLRNTGSNPGVTGLTAGNDVNVVGVWDTYQGSGINLAIVDDGLQVGHPDLSANARTDIDIDINYSDNDPSPDIAGDDHGTACAGVAGARGNNSVGVSGAAPQVGLVGVRLISAAATDAQEAQGLTHQLTASNPADRVSIYSNSWGPSDDGATLEGPGSLARAALQNGVTNGRGGKGALYTWAGGNGGSSDNANYDGYANSRYTIAVGASGGSGEQSSYSESGACLVVNAPSSYSGGGITTVDRSGSAGYEDPPGDYTYTFGGTSSATPLAAGCIALMLQANPNLGWRDVMDILIRTATKNQPSDSGWATNGAGLSFNHKFGFGRVDAGAAVTSALSRTTMFPAEATPLTGGETLTTPLTIPDNNATGITRTTTISGPANFKVESVELKVNITHTWRGDLEFFLTAPSGMVSQIARRSSDSGDNLSNWTFTSFAHWGENPNGTWSFKVADRASSDVGTLSSWTLTIYGHLEPAASVGDWMLFE